MKRLHACLLAAALTLPVATASAQSYPSQYSGDGYYDYARVVRVDPVYDSRYSGRYAASTGTTRCVEDRTYVGGDGYRNDRYDDRYRNDGYYGRDDYGRDPYNGGYANNGVGSTAATVVGGIVGAVLGSKVGGGSARYATSALGSMVGSMAGRQIYENVQRNRQPPRVGVARACDPIPVGDYEAGRGSSGYDVTYEYGGRNYTTRTSYHPGDRIRVRVDVRPE